MQIVEDQMNAVATGGFQVVGGGSGARGSWPGQQQPHRTACHLGDGGRGVHVQREAEMGGVKVDGRLDVVDEVAHGGVSVIHWAFLLSVCSVSSLMQRILSLTEGSRGFENGTRDSSPVGGRLEEFDDISGRV